MRSSMKCTSLQRCRISTKSLSISTQSSHFCSFSATRTQASYANYSFTFGLSCTTQRSNTLKMFFADISVAVVNLLQEMTDVDTLTESEDGADLLIGALVSNY